MDDRLQLKVGAPTVVACELHYRFIKNGFVVGSLLERDQFELSAPPADGAGGTRGVSACHQP